MVDLPRPNTSVVRYDGPQVTQSQKPAGSQTSSTVIPPRRKQRLNNFPRQPNTAAEQRRPAPAHKNVHWLLPVGVGMLAMLVIWITGSWVVAWGNQRINDIRYGNPRTYQTDFVVGHGGDSEARPSHFIAVNLHRQAIVTEFMAGDPAKFVIYVAPVYIAGDGGDLAPVTVEFRDVAGDSKVDMIIRVHLPSQDQLFVFVNDGTKFRPPNNSDKIRL